VTDESEPNDSRGRAARTSCRRACTLHGIVVSSDDPVDYWRINRGGCPRRISVKAGRGLVSARCVRVTGRGGGTFIRVRPRANSQAAYTISVPRR
jgi:hypothetical protein